MLLICRNAAFFSMLRSSPVTGKPSSGGGGSLRGSPRLCGSRGNLRLRGLGPSDVFPLVPLGPLTVSASLSGQFVRGETTRAAAGGRGLSFLPFFKDFGGSSLCAGPLFLRSGGEPREELYELLMAFLRGQELTQEVWGFCTQRSSEFLAQRFLCRDPGLGMKEMGPLWTHRCLISGSSPPVPSGLLCSSPSGTAGSSPCLANPSPLSPGALDTASAHEPRAHPGVVGSAGVRGCSCAAQTGAVPTGDAELQDSVEVWARSTALLRRTRLKVEMRTPRKERRVRGSREHLL
ncbi:hypothetical protein CB1_016571001 [Camelus ferus]|nr:hypothetical protein CB1_016571001 [Camelus ferus]